MILAYCRIQMPLAGIPHGGFGRRDPDVIGTADVLALFKFFFNGIFSTTSIFLRLFFAVTSPD
jgi:hypothetical protein